MAGCSLRKEQTIDLYATPTLKDTINIGSYYKSNYISEIGEVAFWNLDNEEITHFRNDSTYRVVVKLTGKQKLPFRVVSLNANVTVELLNNQQGLYEFSVARKVKDQFRFAGKTVRADARFALLADASSRVYYVRDRSWIDSAKKEYKQYVMRIDTICTYAVSIKDE
jgi:hypothetical protein